MGLFQPASSIEYRYRAAILIVSQPVLAWIAYHTWGFSGEWYAPEVTLQTGVAACCLGFLGVMIRIQSSTYFHSYKVARRTPQTDELIDHGPYSAVRNPLYLGSLIQFAGYGLFFGWLPALIYTILHAIRYQRIILHEEQLLRSRWGDRFDTYVAETPRWLPRNMPALFRGPIWNSDAVLGNGPFLGIAAGMAVSLWSGSLLLLIPLEAAGFVLAGVNFVRPRVAPVAGSESLQAN